MSSRGEQPDNPTPTPKPPRSRRARWIRRFVFGVLVVPPLIVAIGLFIVTRSSFIIAQVEPILEKSLGGEVAIGSASYLGKGVVELLDVTLRARGISGPAGEILKAGAVRIDLDRAALLRGRTRVLMVELQEAVFRAAEDEDQGGSFTFAALHPEALPGGGEVPSIIKVVGGTFEMGVHGKGGYRVAGRLPVSGSLSPELGHDAWFTFSLVEIQQADASVDDAPLRADGRFNAETFEIEGIATGLTLEDRHRGLSPGIARRWASQLDLEGQIETVRFNYSESDPIDIAFTVVDVAMTLPAREEGVWAMYDRGRVKPSRGLPRMQVRSGTIRLHGDEIQLDNLIGKLTTTAAESASQGVEFAVVGWLGLLTDLAGEDRDAWMERELTSAPMDVTFRLPGFELRDDESQTPIEIPLVVANVMQRFGITSCSVKTEVRLVRADPIIGPDGAITGEPLSMSGRMSITNGTGAYQYFPYPLDNIRGSIRFTNDELIVESIVGQVEAGSAVSITGRIAPPNFESAIDLRLEAAGIPLDQTAIDAFPDSTADVFESLFHKPSLESLKAAGLIPDEAALEAARTKQAELSRRIRDLRASDSPDAEGEIETLEAERVALDAVIDRGAFDLGGYGDLSVRIAREFGPDQPVLIYGRLKIGELNFLNEWFPYPLRITGGEILIDPVRIDLVNLPAETLVGGVGFISGRVDLPEIDGVWYVRPNLEVGIRNDPTNPLLLAAIPLTDYDRSQTPSDSSWPGMSLSASARIMDEIGLQGLVSYAGQVTTDPDERINFDFAVELTEGIAEPKKSVFGAMEKLGLTWPQDFTLQDVTGVFRVTRDAIHLAELTGSRGEGRVRLTGDIDLTDAGSEPHLNTTFTNFAIEDYVLDLLPAESRPRGQEIWDRYQPRGRFDATIALRPEPDGTSTPILEVRPTRMDLTIDGESVSIHRESGALSFESGHIGFDAMELSINTAERRDATIHLTGSIGLLDEDSGVEFKGSIIDGRFESVFIPEVLQLLNASDLAEEYAAYEPAGEFEATFGYSRADTSVNGEGDTYEVVVHPSNLAFTKSETRVALQLVSRGMITFVPGQTSLENLRGATTGGATFVLDGTVESTRGIDAELQLSVRSDTLSDELLALVPDDVRTTLESIDFRVDEEIIIEDASIRLIRAADDSGEPGGWRRTLDSAIRVRGASFLTGLQFSEVDASFDLSTRSAPNKPPELRISAQADRLRVSQRLINDLQAEVLLSEDGDSVLLPRFSGGLYGGRVNADAFVAIDGSGRYLVHADVVGVSLGDFATPSVDDDDPDPAATGRLYGGLSLSGRLDDAGARRGRGGLRVLDGKMASAPITLRLLQLSQLMLPLHDDFDFADVGFYVLGDQVLYEHIQLDSPTLVLRGDGTMDFNTFDLDLRFRSRGTMGPISDIVGALTDQLYVIHVTGPLSDPKAAIVPVPGLGGFLADDWMEKRRKNPPVLSGYDRPPKED